MNQHRITEIEKRLDAIEEKIGIGTINVDDEGMFVYSSSFDESKEPCKTQSLWDEILATILLLEADQKPDELTDAIMALLEERGFV